MNEGHEWFSDYSRGRRDFMCLAVLLCEQFCRFANEVPCEQSLVDLPRSTDLGRSKRLCSQGTNEGAKISIKSNFMRYFFLSVFSSSEVLAKITSIRSKLPTAAYWSRGKKRGNCEANLLYVKSDSVDTTDTRDKSFTMFFAR